MGSVDETQTPQPSWHVQARRLGLPAESIPQDAIPTSSIPPDSLLPGDVTISQDSPVKGKNGSQGLSTLPIHPIPKEMRPMSHDDRQFESADTSSDLFPGFYVGRGPAVVPKAPAVADENVNRIEGNEPRPEIEVSPGPANGNGDQKQKERPDHANGPGGGGFSPEQERLGAQPILDLRAPLLDNEPIPPVKNDKIEDLETPLPSSPTKLSLAPPSDTPSIPSPSPMADNLPLINAGNPNDFVNDEEAPNVPSPPESTEQIQTPTRPRRAAAEKSRSAAAFIDRSPEKLESRPITSHDPSPLKAAHSNVLPKSASKAVKTVTRTFKRTISAPVAMDEDSFGEAPRLVPRQRFEKYLTKSPKTSSEARNNILEQDEGEATDQEDAKESNTVSQSLILDDPELLTSGDAKNDQEAVNEPTQINTVGHTRTAISSPQGATLEQLFSDEPISPTPKRNTSNGPVLSDEETEESEQLFTASGPVQRDPRPELTGFARIPSSSAGSSRLFENDSQMFGNKSEMEYGSQDHTQSEHQMAATQAILPEPSSPASPKDHEIPSAKLALSTGDAIQTGQAGNASNSTGTGSARSNLAAHRRLTRQKKPSIVSNPSEVEPALVAMVPPAQSSDARAPRTAPLPTLTMHGLEATQISQPFRSAPLPSLAALEPTQVSQPLAASIDGKEHDTTQETATDQSNKPDAPALPTAAANHPESAPSVPSSISASNRPPVPLFSSPARQSSPVPLARSVDEAQQSEVQATNKTFPPTPPPKPAAVRKYGTPKKGKRQSMPSKRAKEAQEVEEDVQMLSDVSSGSTVSRDPDDETFRPASKVKIKPKGVKGRDRVRPTSPSVSESDLSSVALQDDGVRRKGGFASGGMAKTTARPNQTISKKRKKSSIKTPAGRTADESDGGSSGTTPVDEDDNTYRPSKNGAKRGRFRTLPDRTSAQNSRASSTSSGRNPPQLTKSRSALSKGSRKRQSDGTEAEIPPSHPEQPRQIMGYWSQTKQYFAGTIITYENGLFHVAFYDGAEANLPIDRLRLFDIRQGDEVRTNERNLSKNAMTVVEPYGGNARGVKVQMDDQSTRYIALSNLCVPVAIINKDWKDRIVEPKHLGLSESVDLIRSGPKSSTSLAGKVFLVTINVPDSDGAIRKALEASINAQGGRIAPDWPELFEDSGDGFWSKLATKDAPFLLVHGAAGAKPKTLAALAAGIPCISAEYVTSMAHRHVDWREFLVSPGRSAVHGQYTSQMIDPNWGEASWDPLNARNLRQFLAGKKLLFVISQKNDAHMLVALVRRLIPFCLHALGAVSLEQTNQAVVGKDLTKYDYVIIEDRGNLKIPLSWEKADNTCNVVWLKHCIIAGTLLPAGMMKEHK